MINTGSSMGGGFGIMFTIVPILIVIVFVIVIVSIVTNGARYFKMRGRRANPCLPGRRQADGGSQPYEPSQQWQRSASCELFQDVLLYNAGI